MVVGEIVVTGGVYILGEEATGAVFVEPVDGLIGAVGIHAFDGREERLLVTIGAIVVEQSSAVYVSPDDVLAVDESGAGVIGLELSVVGAGVYASAVGCVDSVGGSGVDVAVIIEREGSEEGACAGVAGNNDHAVGAIVNGAAIDIADGLAATGAELHEGYGAGLVVPSHVSAESTGFGPEFGTIGRIVGYKTIGVGAAVIESSVELAVVVGQSGEASLRSGGNDGVDHLLLSGGTAEGIGESDDCDIGRGAGGVVSADEDVGAIGGDSGGVEPAVVAGCAAEDVEASGS